MELESVFKDSPLGFRDGILLSRLPLRLINMEDR
jgi:hypothetical protein